MIDRWAPYRTPYFVVYLAPAPTAFDRDGDGTGRYIDHIEFTWLGVLLSYWLGFRAWLRWILCNKEG